jgi:ribosomal protein L12E/L44/L45/RPP1/RPP2
MSSLSESMVFQSLQERGAAGGEGVSGAAAAEEEEEEEEHEDEDEDGGSDVL